MKQIYRPFVWSVSRFPVSYLPLFKADGKVDRIEGGFFYTKPHAFYQQCNEADSADRAEKNTAEWLKYLAEMTPDWTVYVDSESLYRSYPKDRRCQHVYTFGQPEDINWTRFENQD